MNFQPTTKQQSTTILIKQKMLRLKKLTTIITALLAISSNAAVSKKGKGTPCALSKKTTRHSKSKGNKGRKCEKNITSAPTPANQPYNLTEPKTTKKVITREINLN